MQGFVEGLRHDFILWLLLLMVVDTIGLPIPSEVPLLYGGYLVSQHDLNFVAAVLVAAVGATIGSLIAYSVSRRFGRVVILRWGKRVLITEEHLHRSEEWFARRGEGAVFVCRFIPLARTLISIPAGIAEMDLRRFLVFTFTGTLPWSAGLLGFGWALGASWKKVLHSFSLASIGVAVLIVAGICLWYVRRRRARTALDDDVRQRVQ
ncbi:MAG: DedA family protein [Actinomycetota bacterium]|nr:DedA family protein [Actinomycetota bacterium]